MFAYIYFGVKNFTWSCEVTKCAEENRNNFHKNVFFLCVRLLSFYTFIPSIFSFSSFVAVKWTLQNGCFQTEMKKYWFLSCLKNVVFLEHSSVFGLWFLIENQPVEDLFNKKKTFINFFDLNKINRMKWRIVLN